MLSSAGMMVVVAVFMSVVVAHHPSPTPPPPPSPYLLSHGFLAPSTPSNTPFLLYFTNNDDKEKVLGQDVGVTYGGPRLSFLSPTFAFWVELLPGAIRYLVRYDLLKGQVDFTFNNTNSFAGFALATEDGTNDILYLNFNKGPTLHRMNQEGDEVSSTDFRSDYSEFQIQPFGAPLKNAFHNNAFYLCLWQTVDYIYSGVGSLNTNGILTFTAYKGLDINCVGDTVIDPEENLVVFQGVYDTLYDPYTDLIGIAVNDLSLQKKGKFIFTHMWYNGVNYTNYNEYGLHGHIDIDTVAKRIYASLAPYPGSSGDEILVSMSYTGDNIAVVIENPPIYLHLFSVVNSSYIVS